ncbi:MAG: hypothetical protein J6U17_00545 [Kiritimatiellae bacterium]|nr:hypothetical protein [Kiritimatiellia bacterium]
MTSSSQTDPVRLGAAARALLAAVALATLAGCIADSAEDSNLPWSSNKSWEGMAPIAPSVMDRYD